MKIQFGRQVRIVATAVIVVFTVFVVGRNALHAVKIKRQINALTREQSYYSEKIAQDSTLLERLKYDDYSKSTPGRLATCRGTTNTCTLSGIGLSVS